MAHAGRLFEGEERRRVSVPGYPFQLDRYWIPESRTRRSAAGHPLLGTRHESPRGEVTFETEVTPSDPAWLSDHRVFERVVAPGALYGAMAASAALSDGPASVVIDDMQLHSPLIFPDETDEGADIDRRVQLLIAPADGSGASRIEVFSRGAGTDWAFHVDGRLTVGAPVGGSGQTLDVASLKGAMERGDAQSLYRARSNTGVALGIAFRGLTDVWQRPGEALGEVTLPGHVERAGIDVHPLLLDACFQVVAGARGASEEDTTAYMPFGWERLWLTGPLPERLICRAQMRDEGGGANGSAAEVLKADLWIYDSDGVPVGGVSGYTAKRATRAALLSSVEALDDLMYEVVWRDRPYTGAGEAQDKSNPPGVWLIAPDREAVADEIASRLTARNQTVVVATDEVVDPDQRDSWRALVDGLPAGTPLRGVIHLAALDGHGPDATTAEMRRDVTHASRSALALVQGLLDADAEPDHGVWFVTRGGQVLEHERSGALAGAMLWGFGKVVTRELSQLPARVIDLDPETEDIPDSLVDELLAPDTETLVAYRAGERRVPRLVRAAHGTPQLTIPDDADWRIARADTGDFRVESVESRPLGSLEVRIAVDATGVDEHSRLVCGRIVETAPDVTDLAEGERVLAVSLDDPGPTAVTSAQLAIPAPPGIPAADLAAIPLSLVSAAIDADEPPSDLAGLIDEAPQRVADALQSVIAGIDAGKWTVPSALRWPMAQAGAAMDHAASSDGDHRPVITSSPIATGRLRDDRAYLVTGGLGGIGGAVAGWLADRGAGTIVLNGRRPPDEAAEDVIRALRDRGVSVHVELADVADADAVRDMLARIDATLPPLGGVIHSVGALSDAALINQSWDRFEDIVWPKVLGAWELHRATEHLDLDLFMLFSSMSGVRGNPGQANYSSANAFLDQLARHRRALGLPGQAVQWGAWLGVGEAEQHRERIEATLAASGTEWMTPRQGVRALDRLVRQDLAVGAVTSMDWSVFAAGLRRVPPLIEELLTDDEDAAAELDELSVDLVARVREAPAGERHGIVAEFLQDELQTLLRLPSRPAPSVAFFELGIDSLMALELRARVNQALGGAYTASNTIAFDYPDTESLAAHLVDALERSAVDAPAQPIAAPAPRLAAPAPDDAIAIIGMACRFPGADGLAAFWQMLETGASGVSTQRNGQGSWEGLQGDAGAARALYRRGGFVEGLDEFDASFFRVSPVEARNMDPQLRLLLETSWHAIEDAGLDPARLRGARTGLYAGIGLSEYQDAVTAQGTPVTYPGVNGGLGIGRVAFALGIDGPALPFEVACASSLVAVHHAAAALRSGEVNVALAGGVNAALSSAATRSMDEFGMLSADGQCRTFDAGASGHVRGEGSGVVILKRLDDALADGDRIWAVIRGSAVNQNSAGASPTAPNGLAQRRVIDEALSGAAIAPADVDYLEAHGVASPLGDAIELEAAAAVYGQGREPDHPLLVGSVKTNVGHLESAAGMASLIKVVLSMQRGVIPAQLHFQDPSPHLDWDGVPVTVTSTPTAWPSHPDRPPLAGISAFGLFGANAHVVIEGHVTEPVPEEASWVDGAPRLVQAATSESIDAPADAAASSRATSTRFLPLSAWTPAALSDLARAYLSWVAEHRGEEATLADAAWTAGVGRRHFSERAAVVFSDADTLHDGLRAVAERGEAPRPVPVERVAFAYGDGIDPGSAIAKSLYEAEPVVRTILDRCEEAFRSETGRSLLAVMLGDEESREGANSPAWEQPARYALQCALTTLWGSIGVRPDVALGAGVAGELGAARAAGVLGLETGMRVAVTLGRLATAGAERVGEDAALARLAAALGDETPSQPAITLVSAASPGAIAAGEDFGAAYWLQRALAPAESEHRLPIPSAMDVQVVVEVGAAVASEAPTDAADGAVDGDEAVEPVVLAGAPRAEVADQSDAFMRSVARAYEAGLDIAFEGLFVGESRRRIALPQYPFQRRRFWLEPRAASAEVRE